MSKIGIENQSTILELRLNGSTLGVVPRRVYRDAVKPVQREDVKIFGIAPCIRWGSSSDQV